VLLDLQPTRRFVLAVAAGAVLGDDALEVLPREEMEPPTAGGLAEGLPLVT
jgi:hypothetical protein